MSTDIVIPALGESISEGVISAWLKADGEWAERDEPVLELETDKITMEIPAAAAGAIHPGAEEGATVAVGAVVGSIDESAAKPAKSQSANSTAAPASKSTASAGAGSETSAPPKQSVAMTLAADVPPPSAEGANATPLAKKIAADHQLNLHSIAGTGPGGRIREQDVLAYIQTHQGGASGSASASPASSSPAGLSREVTHQRMSPLRQRIAARLVEAQQTAAMLTTFNECDMTGIMSLRKKHKEAFAEKHGVNLGFMSFFISAAVSALESFPLVNAQIGMNEKDEPELIKHHYCDIAVAVGTPKGLVVPVVRNCESLSFAKIESSIKELALRARDGKLTLEDMQGGTFTISNGGVYGSMMSTPILNPPQSGILGMHNIIRRPVENPDKPGSGEVVVRPMMFLALSYDHRVVDGAEAVGFLKHVKECIEDPERLLLDL